MSTSRSDILARIRSVEPTPAEPLVRAYRRAGTATAHERVLRFCERVSDYHAVIRRVRSVDIGAEVTAVLKSLAVDRTGVPPDLPTAWRPTGLEVVDDNGLSTSALDQLDAVITGCTVGVAETGRIILAGGASEGRRALTLVPDIHLCVVLEDQIVETVPEGFDRINSLVIRQRRPITLVSGPSATSDIELSRVEGVHGPRTLIVLVVFEEGS